MGDAHTVPRRRWLLTPLFQEGVKDGLPNLLRNLEKAVALGGDVQQSVVALTRMATSAGAVDVVAKARAYGDAPDALRMRELWAALALARRALQQRGILSLRMAPVAARPDVEFPAAEFFAGVAAPPAAQQHPAYTWEQQLHVRRRASRGAASPHE